MKNKSTKKSVSMNPICDGVIKDILASYGIYKVKKTFFEMRVERERADNFDVKAELEKAKKEIQEMELKKMIEKSIHDKSKG